uniref:Uncharacterized protein n=1 Tax=Thermogemmatispora argillosa TaxID=2045280 RepID=A0A455T3X4_9CHLR|nr:hypothetical protein KTA_21200 [Thermogemmatispora argillosa]
MHGSSYYLRSRESPSLTALPSRTAGQPITCIPASPLSLLPTQCTSRPDPPFLLAPSAWPGLLIRDWEPHNTDTEKLNPYEAETTDWSAPLVPAELKSSRR